MDKLDYMVPSREVVVDATTNELLYIEAGRVIIQRRTIARGSAIREIDRLRDQYKHPSGKRTRRSDWTKESGVTIITYGDKQFVAEIHWYQGKDIGKVEFKVKRYIGEHNKV